jgi:hypothetical protein
MEEFSLDPLFRLETHMKFHMLNLPQISREARYYVPFWIHCLILGLLVQGERILQWYILIILAEILGIVHFLRPKTHYVLKAGSAGSVCVFKWNRERQIATLMAQFERTGLHLSD